MAGPVQDLLITVPIIINIFSRFQTSMNVLKVCQTARVKLHASTQVVVTTVIAQLDIMEMEGQIRELAVLVC